MSSVFSACCASSNTFGNISVSVSRAHFLACLARVSDMDTSVVLTLFYKIADQILPKGKKDRKPKVQTVFYVLLSMVSQFPEAFVFEKDKIDMLCVVDALASVVSETDYEEPKKTFTSLRALCFWNPVKIEERFRLLCEGFSKETEKPLSEITCRTYFNAFSLILKYLDDIPDIEMSPATKIMITTIKEGS